MSGDVNSSTVSFHSLVILLLVIDIISLSPFFHLSNGGDDTYSTYLTLLCFKDNSGMKESWTLMECLAIRAGMGNHSDVVTEI